MIVDGYVLHLVFVPVKPNKQLTIVPVPNVAERPILESLSIGSILIKWWSFPNNRDHLIASHSFLDFLKRGSTRVRTGQKVSCQHCHECQRCQANDNAPALHPRILTGRAAGCKGL
jgi:hypothetical protein